MTTLDYIASDQSIQMFWVFKGFAFMLRIGIKINSAHFLWVNM